MIAPARIAAYETLLAVDAGRLDLPAALARTRAGLHGDHAQRDRALAGEIATGTLRWQGAFDAVITAFSGRHTDKLDREIVVILRMGMFQILHLDRVPASAIVDDAVQMARKTGKGSASGFVNAVLRRVSRERTSLPLPVEPPLDFLAITLSHPRWLAARWLERYGPGAAESWMRFDNAPAPLTLRANTLMLTRDALQAQLAGLGVETRHAAYAPDALIVVHGNPLLTPIADTGAFLVQDEASQLVGLFVDAQPGERIFDACASPGGKTTQLAAAVGSHGAVIAADVRDRRIDLLARTVAAAGATNVRLLQADARVPLPIREELDAVLIDAPCSGLGTLRRDPDVKWRRQEADLAPLAQTQLSMLDRAAAVVRPGGRIIYSTCSSEPDENDAVVAAFLEAHPRFLRKPAASFADGRLADLLDEQQALRTLPFRHGLEGFYAACLVNS